MNCKSMEGGIGDGSVAEGGGGSSVFNLGHNSVLYCFRATEITYSNFQREHPDFLELLKLWDPCMSEMIQHSNNLSWKQEMYITFSDRRIN